MRRRFRLVFLMAAVAAALIVTALILDDSQGFNHLAGWVTIGSSVSALGIGAAIWAGTLRASAVARSDSTRVELILGHKLELEAKGALSPVLSLAGKGHTVNLRFDKMTSPFRDHGGGATGDLVSVAEYFKSLSPGRLVVLGGPGSGKSVLAIELQAQLLELRSQGNLGLFPVLIRAVSYHPGMTWANWMTAHLAQRYLLPKAAAAQLVADGRILPIIDGVDELERATAAALITELDVYIRERESSRVGKRPRMVITCRAAEYQDLAGTIDEAAHVELRPLTTGDVKTYLLERGIKVPDALASILTSPLMLSLAGTIYGADADSGQSINDLLRLPDETAVERHLLEAFLANAYRRTHGPGSHWSHTQAERWLAMIGSHMRALSTEGFSWRQITYAMPSGLLSLLSGAATCLGLVVTFTLLGIGHQVFGDRMSSGLAISSLVIGSIVPAIVAALLVEGLNSGWLVSSLLVVSSRVLQAASGPLLAQESFEFLLMSTEFWRSTRLIRQGPDSDAVNSRADLVQARRRAVIAAAVVGVTLGILAVALHLVGAHIPRDATVVFACYCMVVTVLCSPWGSFQLARAWFCVRGELPYRLLHFLEDQHQRGVLRSAGPRFEFTNDAIRKYFSDPARLPEVRREISALTGWALGNPEIRESYRYAGADRSDIEQAVSSLATETILAGQPFVVDAVMRQAVLERVRVRLNELGHRSAFEQSLVAREAPGLGAVIDPSQVILTRTMDDLARLIDRIPSASLGISGIRGIGKSTLIRWLCTERNASGQAPALGIYVTAPVEYNARDFLVHLYITLCKAVLADDRFTDHRARQHRDLWRAALVFVLAIAGTGVYYHHDVDREVTAKWTHVQSYLWSAAASVLFTGALFVLMSVVNGMRRRRGGGRRRTSLEATARDRLHHLRYQVVETTGQAGKLTGPFGLSFSGSRSRQITENQMTLPELVDSYREFAELTVSALQESAQLDGPVAIAQVRLVVGIDEIDRIEDAGNAEKFLNDIKAIFGTPNCFYVASLSADALANFERRVLSTRTAFDTTFDTVLRIGPLELGTARQVLERRAIGLPYPFITLCYVLSGGVPRELMRIARSIFDIRNDARFASADEKDAGAVACAVIAPRVISREMESLRQGLMPLATQLNVPGATELIGLLDDPDWPSGETQDDLAKLTKIIGQRALFQDETGNTAAAVKVCDGLAAASFFFLSVDELFRTRLGQIVADLRLYDAAHDQGSDQASSIHLLARARTAIGVNPALAVTRIQVARKGYGLPGLTPVLLSQLPADSTEN